MNDREKIVEICRATIAAPEETLYEDYETGERSGEDKLARKILDLLGEKHGDEAERAQRFEAERIYNEKAAREYAEHVARVAAENARLEELKAKRIAATNAAIRDVYPDFVKARADADTLAALEVALNAHAANARREHGLGRMKVSIDHAGNVGVAWVE